MCSDQAAQGSGELVTFMFPQANYSQARPYIQCPPGQAAVGYSAQAGRYSLTNVTVRFLALSVQPFHHMIGPTSCMDENRAQCNISTTSLSHRRCCRLKHRSSGDVQAYNRPPPSLAILTSCLLKVGISSARKLHDSHALSRHSCYLVS